MSGKKPHVMAIDSNNFMMRANYAYKELSVDNQPSGMVYGYIKLVQQYVNKYKPDYFIPLFDNGRSKYRTSIDANYKGNRGDKDEAMVVQMKACREFMRLAGWTPYMEQNTEADDLAAKVAKDCSKDNFVMLVSADHDWQQLVRECSVIHIKPGIRGNSDKIITHDKLQEDWGFPPERWPELAAIMGDGGDNVIGLKGYGWKKSMKLIAKYGDLWTACTKEPVLIDNASQILKNYELTKLDGTVPTKPVPLEQNRTSDVEPKAYDNDELLDFCDRWHLASIRKQLEQHEFWQ